MEANPDDVAGALGKEAGTATTGGINAGLDYAKHQLDKSANDGAQSKIMKLITNPKNLAKIVHYIEKIFDKLLNELDTILHGVCSVTLLLLVARKLLVYLAVASCKR